MGRKTLIACAGVLLAALLGLAAADNVRPWRRLQAEYVELERRHLDARLTAVRDQQSELLSQLSATISTEEARLESRRDEIDELESDLRAFRGKARVAELRLSRSRAELESAGQPPRSPREAAPRTTELDELRGEVRLARMEVEGLHELIADREHKLETIRGDLMDARHRWAEASAPIEAVVRKRRQLGRDTIPFLPRLWSSSVKIRQVAVVDYPAVAGTERLDRCATCHLAAVRDGLGGEERPPHAPAHPRPELFVEPGSPHPYARFGCTVCHGGAGRATDFSRAGHTPGTAEQEAAWIATRRWRRASLPARPMLPLDLTEAACASCHPTTTVSETLERGRSLISALGCTGCHPSHHPSLAGQPMAGPSLAGIAGKTRPAWAFHWLAATHERPRTWMPELFGRQATDGDAERDRRSTEIRSVVHYLWQRSRTRTYEQPAEGDVEAGRDLFAGAGCAACHVVEPGAAGFAYENRHGPDLSRIGSKVSAGWLRAWLLDPRAYHPESPMPSLRLTEDEATDLVAYLMTRRDPEWEDLGLPPLSAEIRDALALSHLERSHGIETSQARLEAMTDRERTSYLGERTIANLGCHACHQIPGFETAPPPEGPSLEEIADRLRRRPGVGGDPARRHRWLPAAHTPAYRLTPAEATAVTAAVLGLGAPYEPDWAADDKESALAVGGRIVRRYNCRGCHVIEGRGGWIAGGGGRSQAPPDLTHTGARLTSPWLFAYLAHPERFTARSWLTVRMPSFALDETELNALVRYFAALNGREILTANPPGESPIEISRAVGEVVFTMLQCDSCHDADGPTAGPQLAPSYRLAGERFRPDWVVDWILDPQRWRPGTPMPATFRGDPGSDPDSAFLIGSISTPIFSPERERLRRLLGSDDELHSYLADPERVATALRDYLWTLGE